MSDCPHDPYAQHHEHCLSFGAQPCSASASPRTHFRLWAPADASVKLELDPDGPAALMMEMTPAGGGWFEAFTTCGAGTRYRYWLDDAYAIPDPASRSQPDGAEGASEVIDPRAFTWRNTFWRGRPWEEIALYAIHPGAAGGYEGVRRRLAGLARLGVTAIELLAVAQGSGLPFAPSAAYGGPHALKALIDEAHGHGLAVLLDLDYASFGTDGDALRRYAEPFFHMRDDPLQAPPLALDQPEVRDFFCDNALYWVNEYRCDGLRLREADRIDSTWLREIADRVHGEVCADRIVHLVLGSERHPAHLADTHFDAQWNGGGERALHRLTGCVKDAASGAISARQSIHALARALTAEGAAYHYHPVRALPSDVGAADVPMPLSSLVLSDGIEEGGAQNGRHAGLAALALSLLTPQIPLVFDEVTHDAERRHFVQSALAVRAKLIAPRLSDARPQRADMLRTSDGAEADALVAAWQLGDGESLSIALNLSPHAVPFRDVPPGMIVFETPARARDQVDAGELPPYALVAWLTGDVNHYALTHDARLYEDGGARLSAGLHA